MIREAGGLCIADEVQTGFGRTGSAYWGFQNQVRGVVVCRWGWWHGLLHLTVCPSALFSRLRVSLLPSPSTYPPPPPPVSPIPPRCLATFPSLNLVHQPLLLRRA